MKPLSTLMGVITGAMVAALGTSGTAHAADFSLRGSFVQDSGVQLFDFSVDKESTVTLRTYSYGGGTQADGTPIAAGGFDPVLNLFDATGNRLFANDDDKSGTVLKDPATNQAYDSFLKVILAAGNYTVSLTQYGNFTNSTNLADGFGQTGNFTGNFSRCAADSAFCDFTGNSRTNRWAFDVLGVQPVIEPPTLEPPTEPDEIPIQVPEPATTAAFVLTGLGAMATTRRKK
ncbi:DVUA0089 family protein [Leptothoe sp. PORK10 BA2]|uniref:DVUA0089 family protein n=1 Tax=Leptothoe sp. PORK10 BA2 TaxID=3110254 RepID=UPI002B2189B8|nr:DVUA0089 family protein [Leptothoe sp. PORK10 BA2]MEA5463142.1 DVUA0089 family protein [Leptothoe sp. PORK10 BA2]